MAKKGIDIYEGWHGGVLNGLEERSDGVYDPKLRLEYDPLFHPVLGTGVNRRALLKAAGLAALGSVIPRAYAADKKFDPVVRIGYLPITDAAALLVAHEKGFLKQQGLDSIRPTMVRSWQEVVESFESHRFNLTHLLIPVPIWMRYGNHFPVKIVAWDHTNGSAMVVRKGSGIKSFKDLGGKQFAQPFWYSIHNIISQLELRNAGIKPVIRPQSAKLASDECNLLILPPPDMPPALASGKIDAYCVAEPFNALGELLAGGEVLRFTGDIWRGHPCCVVCMHEADAMDPARAQWAQAVLNAIVQSQIYIDANRTEVAHLLSRDGQKYLPFPAKVVERAMVFYNPTFYKEAIKHPEWHQDRIDMDPWPYPSATERVTTDLQKTLVTGDRAFLDKLTPEFVAKDLVNYEHVKKATEKFPAWKKDASVSTSSDPYVRTEVIDL
ncbi:MAG TPA: ABC transporter substrate-binding protein [Burkholderiales bacterium]|nr:ABC transporter substrate-binding protein [Burkholderiales bacterium]